MHARCARSSHGGSCGCMQVGVPPYDSCMLGCQRFHARHVRLSAGHRRRPRSGAQNSPGGRRPSRRHVRSPQVCRGCRQPGGATKRRQGLCHFCYLIGADARVAVPSRRLRRGAAFPSGGFGPSVYLNELGGAPTVAIPAACAVSITVAVSVRLAGCRPKLILGFGRRRVECPRVALSLLF